MRSITFVGLDKSSCSLHGPEDNIGILDLAFKSLSLDHLILLYLVAQLVHYVLDVGFYGFFLGLVRGVLLLVPQSLS